MKPHALDLFCGAGGATKGLQRAGFHVTGIDHKPQPRYCGDQFIQADALAPPVKLEDFDFIWASPPCQAFSQLTPPKFRDKHKNHIPSIRLALERTGRPFVIENVPSAVRHLRASTMLCGSMFGLQIQRHRFFETSFIVLAPECDHSIWKAPVLISGTHRRTYEPRYEYTADQCRKASGLYWMRRIDMDQAIPPAYAEFIGQAALQYLARGRAA